MGRNQNYNVKTKVQRLPVELEGLFREISTAYGNSKEKEKFIIKLRAFLDADKIGIGNDTADGVKSDCECSDYIHPLLANGIYSCEKCGKNRYY